MNHIYYNFTYTVFKYHSKEGSIHGNEKWERLDPHDDNNCCFFSFYLMNKRLKVRFPVYKI